MSIAVRVAERAIRAMAFDRQGFINRCQEHLGGALLEFYKACAARKNGQTKWVAHWMSEVETLLEHNLVNAILHPIKGFTDRKRAFATAVAELKAADAGYRRTAQNTVVRDFGLQKLKIKLDDEDTEAFWKLVERAVATAFSD